jgi:hypothetical protein
MTRKSKREIETELEELTSDRDTALRQPFTAAEREQFGDAVDLAAWSDTPQRRAVLRSLAAAGREATTR